MRLLVIVLSIIGLLVLGKVFLFPATKGETTTKLVRGGSEEKKGGGKGGDKGPVEVQVYRAVAESVENTLTVAGTVLPNESVELKAEVPGRLVRLLSKEGTAVAKGELIAKINDKELKAQLDRLNYVEQRAKELETRQKRLLALDGTSKEEYAIAATNALTAGADKELLLAQLEKTEIRAPFSGKIGLRVVSEGAFMMPGTLVATLVQTNPVRVDFAVPEKYAQNLRAGGTLELTSDAFSGALPARISAISPLIDPTLRTLQVRAVAPNGAGRLVPGMFVRVQVNLSGDVRSILVPSQAIVPELKGKKVFLVKNGKARETFVKTGLRSDQRVQITEGLAVGDSVIVTGIMALRDGSPVVVAGKAGIVKK